MNWSGILLAVITFLVIGIFHPIVIKCEYYFSDRCCRFYLRYRCICCPYLPFRVAPIAGCAGLAQDSAVGDSGTGIFGLFGQHGSGGENCGP
ncbi:MAG: DUF4491 family protein [Lachnospiraceae bacterium]|nr:DUF4491 family protein [Lachnospiraceae bacterium]